MQVTIVESEIKEAIRMYLKNNIGLSEEKKINIDFTATRGNEGLKASIDILNDDDDHVKSPAEIWADQVVEAVMKPKKEKMDMTVTSDLTKDTPVLIKEPVIEPVNNNKEATYVSKPSKSLFANLTA